MGYFLIASISVFGQAKKFDKKFGFFEYELVPSIQIVDSQNNHIVAGQFKGFHQVGNSTIQTRGDFDIFIIKYDVNNAIVWVKTFGSSAEDNLASLSCDKVGNIYITGFYSGNAFYSSATDSLATITGYAQSRYVTKLNSSGNHVWSKRFSASTTSGGDPSKSEVINDHDGRVYLIHTTRANGTLNSWQFQDSVIANPTFNHINVPRWLLTRLDENTGNIKWLDYIANPSTTPANIRILNISRPVIDKNNHLVFSISHYGDHITPIYVFGQYAAVNANINNILVRIDSFGTVRNFRDLGTATNALSDIAEIALNNNNEVVLINKKAKATDNGITYDYTAGSNTFNYARIYDENFNLVKIVKLGQQLIKSYVFDKQNRLITLGTSNPANFNQSPVDEVLSVDSSSRTVTFNTTGTILPYYFRYNTSYKLDTFYLENRVNPLISFGVSSFALRMAKNGDIIPSVSYPVMNMTMFRYDSTLRSKNALIGKHRDREDMILGIVEDTAGQIYTTGVIHGLANFNSLRNAADSIKIPFELGQDNFIAKYNKEGNIVWIKKIATPANDIISQMTISKTGIYFTVGNPSFTSWNFNDSVTVQGMNVLMKVDFNGNLLWSKEIYTTVNPSNPPTRPSINLIKTLNNDNVLIGIYAYNSVNISTTVVQNLGNRTGQVYAVLNGINGNIIRFNRFALRSENFSQIGFPISNAYEDKKGNLYFAFTSNVTNPSVVNRANELYSLQNNAISFTNTWASQVGLLKLDSTLEMSKFNQFMSYMFLGDISGQGDHIYITGRSRNNSMTYNSTVIPTHSYAQNQDFVSFFARLDTALNITKVTKFDTTTIESQFNLSNRKILIDTKTKNVYETLQFSGKTGLENVTYKSTSFGGTDLMFIKHDSTGTIIGGQHLGTPQSDSYSAGLINQTSSLIFTSRSVDPNYSTIILSPRLSASPSIAQINKENILPNIVKSNASSMISMASSSVENSAPNGSENVVINKEILSPDTYLSNYISLNELGNRPDTSVLSLSKITFCQGDSSVIEINDASRIRWKKDQQFISSEGSKLIISSTGTYKAIIKNIEGIEDSTRAITINVTPTPTAPTVANASYCIGVTTGQLTATANSTNTLLWYGTAATAGTFTTSSTAPSSSTVGQTNYYVSQKTIENACESPRAAISVTINAFPVKPTITNPAYCVGNVAPALTATIATGNVAKWYSSETASTQLNSVPIPPTNNIGKQEYFVSQQNATTGCEGPKEKITVTINATPEKPTVNNLTYCEGVVAPALTASVSSGNVAKWYNTDTATIKLNATPIPETNNVGKKDYFVTQQNTTTGCEGPKEKITITINATPQKPIVNNLAYCVGAVAPVLTAGTTTGNEVKWYSSDTATIQLNSVPIPDTKNVGVKEFFVNQRNAITGCEGLKSKISVTINPIPSIPNISRLDGNRLTSNTVGSVWYLDTLAIADTNNIIKPNVSGKYFVKSNQNGCISSFSQPYYFLITDILNINADEVFRFSPNPFNNYIKVDFVYKGVEFINIDFIQLSTGIKTYSKTNIRQGSIINLPTMPSGTYLLTITAPGNKLYKQFKTIKL